MRVSWAKMALVAVMAGSMLATATHAIAQQAPEEVRVDVFLKDADLLSATKVLTQRAGLQFMIEQGGDAFGKITLKLDNVTAEEAIRYICQAAGAYYKRDERGVYIISHTKPAEPQPAISDNPKPAKSNAPRVLKRCKLLKTDPRDVYEMLMYGKPFDTGRGFDDLARFMRDHGTDRDAERMVGMSRANFLSSQTPSYQPINSRANSDMVGSENGNQVTIPGETESARQGFGGGGAGTLGGGGQGRGGQGPGGQGPGGGNGQGTQLTPGQFLVPEGIDFISYDPTTNELVVRGTEDAIAELQRYVSLFDVAPKQVQIKVEFVTTTDDLDRSLGYDFLYQRGAVFAGTLPGSFARSGDPIFLNYATGNITSRLRASLAEGRGKVVNAPIIRTLNNQPAFINSAVQTYIFITTTSVSNGTIIQNSNPFPLTATTSLAVAPRINDDGTITCYLNPTISQFVGTSRGPNGEEIPNLVQQNIGVVARVKDGETIVLGGLSNKNDQSTTSRIPLLSDLPVIGQFFRGTVRRKRNSDLLIFVTPTIVTDQDVGTSGG